ncbi:mannose-1-phosphate guanylyltransferase [Clostridium beijerinckii]|uniref:mannose-1-phosphate guanylyltransferase n=1 Tax=Clostridium beijerinckii TaxID=1520 RepID=UPI001360FDFA|nr:mannose-1-phosphate guanylyltransferase [Clostridium beijerinckii]MZK52734.1 NTP transferase domain-containing protein [Clostridium beijerinckii]MZK60841.1 NTP transferase domain-containing protein [Clostridium beijerinckii]MZK71047.1 NTP transferase domain-containing protein [Clostridium beijerinckii]MZK76388.1 NTP transferase domain-containing protein [Clostridium beijerinckii]MZK86106.1 NTP transferase domain-containing protein [Clostridium beijerinckii]
MLCALIMAGGKGTRFWPLSTEEKPKQFLNLIGKDTMIQMTVNRIKPIIPIERIFVCTGEKYVNLVKDQLPELPAKNIIIEPDGRNTTPCIALSAFVIRRYYKDANMIVLPSDHLIRDEDKFRNIVQMANDFLENNEEAIVTLGMKPDRPETGYGYIKYTNKVEEKNEFNIFKVDKFVEKPNEEKAKKYLEDGSYLWNGGMFLWKTSNIINEIKKYSPETYEAIHEIGVVKEEFLQDLINDKYHKTESISIDYSVLEKSTNVYVIPSEIGWDDIGTWKAVERYKEKDINDNILYGNARVIESKCNIAINSCKRVVMIGIEDVMTLETEDSIYIINKEYMENLRDYQNRV